MELLERHFDIALKSPDGIKKLRELILSLAMQGKLVPQDASDQPASELLKEIEAEKKKLIKEGRIKKQEPLPPIKPEEIPYEVPAGWEWCRIGDILTVIRGASPRPKGDPRYFSLNRTAFHWIKISDIRKFSKDGVLYDTEEFLTEEGCKKSIELPKGTLVLTNSATIGVPIVLGMSGGCIHDGFLAFPFFPHNQISQDFILYLFQNLKKYAVSQARGLAQLNLNTGIVREFSWGVPPLAEQKRIVAKIDQLMALCDKLEAERDARNKKRVTLHAAAMARLLSAPDEAAFSASWEFITRNFSDLYSVPENVAELKKAILQLAVMGKLVPQDANDQPASELLKEIEAEKKRLIKEGKIKKQEPLPPIKPEEIPYAVPAGWAWARLGEVCKQITDGEHQTPPRIPEGRCLLSAKNIRDGFIDYSNHDCISDEDYFKSRKRCCPEYGDLLIVSVGGTIGRNSLVIEDDEFALVRSVALIKSIIINPQYLRHTMNSVLLQGIINEKKRGGAQPCLYLSEIAKFVFPIPPLAEQKRIVAKVDQLMELCNSLEQQLQDSTRKQTAILGALLATM